MIPGWVDLQVNGYNGINFSDITLSLEQIYSLNNQLLQQGIIGYCPTIISSSLEVYRHNLPIIAESLKSQNGAQILGIHLEGPFINPEDGYRGIHLRENIILPSIEQFKEFRNLSQNNISIITLAPELIGAEELIKFIIKTGNEVISIGHSNADQDIIHKAVNFGVKAASHIGNGLPILINRHKNPIWSLLSEDKISGLFITDGFHLPKDLILTSIKAKKISNFIVASDMMHLAGRKPGNYIINDIPIVLEENGYLHIKGSQQLSGSARNMMDCMNYLNSIVDLDESDIFKIGYE
ncbi:MAG: glucosamine-6-phosphate isomerase, partial [archaeon]|nr:glucosamine-6-phosphate isomerase [archaeon]